MNEVQPDTRFRYPPDMVEYIPDEVLHFPPRTDEQAP